MLLHDKQNWKRLGKAWVRDGHLLKTWYRIWSNGARAEDDLALLMTVWISDMEIGTSLNSTDGFTGCWHPWWSMVLMGGELVSAEEILVCLFCTKLGRNSVCLIVIQNFSCKLPKVFVASSSLPCKLPKVFVPSSSLPLSTIALCSLF